MIPGMNPRKMQQMMKQLGMTQEDIEAEQIIIKTKNGHYEINSPKVTKVDMMGQTTLQVQGEMNFFEKDSTPDINEEDIKVVAESVSKSKEIIKETLIKNKGDIAQTIIDLSED